MKTKLIPWWENIVRYIIFITILIIITFGIVTGLTYLMTDHTALAEKGLNYWTYKVDTRYGPMQDWKIMAVIMSSLMFIIGTFLFVATDMGGKRTLFSYEIKKGLVPFINGKAIASPNKKNIDSIEWKENFKFERTIFPPSSNKEHNNNDNIFMIKKTIFVDHLDNVIRNNGGLRGIWTWKWNRNDFIELVLVRPVSGIIKQLELDFGGKDES